MTGGPDERTTASATARRGLAAYHPGMRPLAPLVAVLAPFALVACVAAQHPAPPKATAPTDAELAKAVRAEIESLGPGARAAVWCGAAGAAPLCALRAAEPMPVASAIKAAFLVELFDAFADALDEPLPGAADVLRDPAHPAVAHFSAAQRETALRDLGAASVRRLGEAMITGRGIDNATYNLAANLVIAHFGGPAKLTGRLHARAPSWRGLAVRRYMLADRTAHGDNEATAAALASVHAMLLRGEAPRVPAAAIDAAREVLARPRAADGTRLYWKGGSLDSAPVTRVRAGARSGGEAPEVAFAVLVALDEVPAAGRRGAGQRLAAVAERIEELLLRAAK